MRGKGKIFLVDDDELIISMLSRALKGSGYEVNHSSRTDGLANKIQAWLPDIVMLDINLPGQSGFEILRELVDKETETQIIMLTADDTAETAVRAMKMGAADYLTKPFNIEEVKVVIENTLEKVRLKQEVKYLRELSCQYFSKDLLGESPAINELKTKAGKMARARVSNILITGESGTGKELLARYIHREMYGDCSHKERSVPFIAVNCTALPENLLESELFGYEKGAFTDAKTDKKGMFEQARDGTLLLDEIGDMKYEIQSKLLRVLEERAIRRVGGKEEIPVETTVIATTNRSLPEGVEAGTFRKDLFFRLNAFYLHIPPLRERREDILVLARHFLMHYAGKYNNKAIKGFSPSAEETLSGYAWPGNVRELKNLVERIVVLESAEIVGPEHLPTWINAMPVSESSLHNRFVLPDTGISLDELEKDLIEQALVKAGKNKTLAAKLLNISYDSLRYSIKKFGLDK